METAWACGLFEGEGSISRVGRVRLSLKMTSETSVRRFSDAVGFGKVYGPYGPHAAQPNRTPYFMWVADGHEAAKAATVLSLHVSEPCKSRLEEMSR